MTDPNIFNIVLVWPITNILIALYQGLYFLHIPFALSFAIILLTVVIRLILAPLTAAQLKTSAKMQKITPHLNKLKELHKNDAKMLQSETMRLYKEHGVNPAAGCLPALLQLPIIWSLYSVLQHVVSSKPDVIMQLNKIVYFPFLRLHTSWDTHFFGLSLGVSPSQLLSHVGLVVLLFPIVTALLQFIQSKMMFGALPTPTDSTKKNDDFSSAMQTQSLYIFPIMIAFFSWSLPLGLSFYWNTFTIFGIIQQYYIQGWGGLSPWIAKIKKN